MKVLIQGNIFLPQISGPIFFFLFSLSVFLRLFHMARNRDQLRSSQLMGIYFKAMWEVMRMKRSLNNQAGRSNEELEHRSSLFRAQKLSSGASYSGNSAPAPVVPRACTLFHLFLLLTASHSMNSSILSLLYVSYRLPFSHGCFCLIVPAVFMFSTYCLLKVYLGLSPPMFHIQTL